MSKEIKTLATEIHKINNEVENIHYGGCGAFARRLYNTMHKLGYKPQVVAIIRDEYLENTQEWINYGENQFEHLKPYFLHVVHIVVKVGKYYIDNRGIHTNTNKFEHCEGHNPVDISYDVLCLWDNIDGWNPTFNRRDLPKIEKHLEDVYKKVQKSLFKSKQLSIFGA